MQTPKTYIGTKIIEAVPHPDRDGYTVRYADGYTSFSPRAAFEEAYRPFDGPGLSFGHALVLLKRGNHLAREGWNGKGMWIALQVPDAHSKMGLPYLYMNTVGGKLVPWLASQTDMLAEDWRVVY